MGKAYTNSGGQKSTNDPLYWSLPTPIAFTGKEIMQFCLKWY